jgi:hypothetical protein
LGEKNELAPEYISKGFSLFYAFSCYEEIMGLVFICVLLYLRTEIGRDIFANLLKSIF